MHRLGRGSRTRSWPNAILATVIAGSLAGPSHALAATQVGNDCESGIANEGVTSLQRSKDPASPLPVAAPAAGVVTGWKLNSLSSTSFESQMKAFRATGAENEYRVVGESDVEVVEEGPNSFATRIPVQAGDLFGTSAGVPSGAAFFCGTGNPADEVVSLIGIPEVGSTETYTPFDGFLVGVLALIEPDADGDGYGDETQDQCPQDPVFQGTCPILTPDPPASLFLNSRTLFRRGTSVVIEVAASSAATVTVSASAKFVQRRKGAPASARVTIRPLTKTVPADRFVRFRLTLPKRLTLALRSLAPRKSLKLRVLSRATDAAGTVATDRLTVKLRGQRKR